MTDPAPTFAPLDPAVTAPLDAALAVLKDDQPRWTAMPTAERIALLRQVRTRLIADADAWVDLAARRKGLEPDSPLIGEEWSSGPWVTLLTIDLMIEGLSHLGDPDFVQGFPGRRTRTGQLAVEVFPRSIFDHLLLSGVKAEIWMEPGVDRAGLAATRGPAAASDPDLREKVSLVLGAGNITSIAPLDALYKLFTDDSVVLLKLNPVLESLAPVFERILEPLIKPGFLRIVTGGADVGGYLARHPVVQTLHITGSEQSHNAIVYGPGPEGEHRRAESSPLNFKPITSELGGVGPTIVAPGRWTDADLRFQAEHIATQKLHNAGFNCIAVQVLILPEAWKQADAFEHEVRQAIARAARRPLYYPGTEERLKAYGDRFAAPTGDRLMARLGHDAAADAYAASTEVFGPALAVVRLSGDTPLAYLQGAADYANDRLHGGLAANIVIDPKTERALGAGLEDVVARLRFGTVAINAWSGLGYLLTQTPWGGWPGQPLNDVQSGIGFVHNAYMFGAAQRSVVRAPFRPFPRNLLHGEFALLPRPPWFVTNRNAAKVARGLMDFQARPSWLKLPGIFANALTG